MHGDGDSDHSTPRSTDWDFAAVDGSHDPQSFVRYLEQRPDGDQSDLRRQLSYALLEVREGQHLLDVGCGLGDDVRALARLIGATGIVVGLDNSARLLEVARGRSGGAAYVGEFIQADMHHIPFAEATFDGCRAERVLVHSAQPTQVVEEMWRVVRPGGRIVVTEPDLDTLVFHASSQAIVRRLTHWHSDSVRNGTIGRRLPEIFRHVGLEESRLFRLSRKVCSLPAIQLSWHSGHSQLECSPPHKRKRLARIGSNVLSMGSISSLAYSSPLLGVNMPECKSDMRMAVSFEFKIEVNGKHRIVMLVGSRFATRELGTPCCAFVVGCLCFSQSFFLW